MKLEGSGYEDPAEPGLDIFVVTIRPVCEALLVGDYPATQSATYQLRSRGPVRKSTLMSGGNRALMPSREHIARKERLERRPRMLILPDVVKTYVLRIYFPLGGSLKDPSLPRTFRVERPETEFLAGNTL